MKRIKSITTVLALMATSMTANAQVHETFLNSKSLYVGAKFTYLFHSEKAVGRDTTAASGEFKLGKEFVDNHSVELYYLMPTSLDEDIDSKFTSAGVRYSYALALSRRMDLVPSIGVSSNQKEVLDIEVDEWAMNLGLGVKYTMLDRSTSIGFGITSYDHEAEHIGAYLNFDYHF